MDRHYLQISIAVDAARKSQAEKDTHTVFLVSVVGFSRLLLKAKEERKRKPGNAK
jgi:hypothetical protein